MSQPDSIRVMIVDDHAMVRSGLRMFLLAFDDLLLAGEAANGLEAVALAESVNPDVILMDLIMPNMDGLHAAHEIHLKHPQIKIIALTSFSDPSLMRDALSVGISGYLFKDASANELATAIRSVHAGNTIFAPEVAQALVSTGSAAETLLEPLTPREMEVLMHIVRGKTNAEISRALTLSLSTTKFHVSNIMSKLNAHNRGEVISLALKNRLVDLPKPGSE
jgi:NarL family two-component system response regulator LiaR